MKSSFSPKGLFALCAIISFAFVSNAQIKKQPVQQNTLQTVEYITKQGVPAKFVQSFQKVYQETNTEKLYELQAEFNARNNIIKAATKSYALLHNIPLRVVNEEKTMELQRVLENGTLIYFETKNVNAAISTRTNYLNTGG